MSSIPVYFDIKDVAASGQVVIGCLYLGFMAGTAFIIHGYVIGIRVIFPICDSRLDAETFLVFCSKFSGKSFGRSGEYTVIVLIFIRVLVCLVPDM